MGNPAPPSPVPYRADWRHQALCRDEDPEIFFGENCAASTAAARAVCAVCPVRRPCLAEGIREPYGVRAGLTEVDRDPLGRAHAAHLTMIAAVDARLRELAAGDQGHHEALTALATEGEAVTAVALAVAAGAPRAEIETAITTALDAQHATAAALSELHVPRPAELDQAAVRLLSAAATAAAAVTTTTRPSVPVIAAVA